MVSNDTLRERVRELQEKCEGLLAELNFAQGALEEVKALLSAPALTVAQVSEFYASQRDGSQGVFAWYPAVHSSEFASQSEAFAAAAARLDQ